MRMLAALTALSALAAVEAVAFLWALGRARQLGYEEARVEAWAEVQGMLATGRLRLPEAEEQEAGDFGAPAGERRVAWMN